MTVKKARMEEKASGKQTNPVQFVGDVKAELKKITWTSPEELRAYTKITLVATFVFGMGIYLIDLLIQGSLFSLSSLVQLING